jgi:hypothetical protein
LATVLLSPELENTRRRRAGPAQFDVYRKFAAYIAENSEIARRQQDSAFILVYRRRRAPLPGLNR